MRCQTFRTKCRQEAEWVVKTRCCSTEYQICGQHALQNMAEWREPHKYLFSCGLCGMQEMPKPEWRSL